MKLNLLGKDFYKDVFTLMGGIGIAQVIPIAVSPILTRLYTPEEFGLLAFYAAWIAIIGVVATGRYEMAILIPDSDSKAKNLAAFAVLLVAAAFLITLFVFLLFGKDIIAYLGFEGFDLLIILIPAGVLGIALFQVFIYLLNRTRDYKGMATTKIGRSGGGSAVQLLLGYASFSTYGLLFGKLFGDLISTAYGWWLSRKNERLKDLQLDWGEMKNQAKTYREFPKVNAPHALTNTSSSSLPNILLASFFSSGIAGFYSLSHRICFAPVQLISSSVQQVYSRTLTERYNRDQEIHDFSISVCKQLSLAAVVPFGILLLFAPSLFEFVFGESWREAGVYSQILTPFLFMVFIVSPLTYIPLLLNEQRKAFKIDIVYLILRVAALTGGLLAGSAWIAIAAFSAVGVAVQLYLLFWILSLTKTAN